MKGAWQIPDDAVRPADGRVRTGRYIRQNQTFSFAEEAGAGYGAKPWKKPLPIGISDYARIQEDYYYVDKTKLIRDFLDRKPLVSLFTRPRRFGKTLNMDMLRVFFEKTEEDTSRYFRDKYIWRCGAYYRDFQGKYPVIFLTFKDVKFDTWEETAAKLGDLLQAEFGRHRIVLEGDAADYEKEYFLRIMNGEGTEADLVSALEKLSKMLFDYYGIGPVIIIDEYDTPIVDGYSKNFYEEAIGFMRKFFSGGFKDNRYLSYGFLTGILRIAQGSIFSGLNNLSVHSVLDDEYASCFGFTETEIRAMLDYYGVSDREEELKKWYDGYRFGQQEIYNPWSVINYISRDCKPQAYWVNTGRNEILEDILKIHSDDISEKLYSLLRGEQVLIRIDQNIVFSALSEDPGNIFSLLVMAGYLKTETVKMAEDGASFCLVSIPNREIAAVYKNEILVRMLETGSVSRSTAGRIAESLYMNDPIGLQNALCDYMTRSISFYDGGAEGFYHGMVLGLTALMDERYMIRSNRESGHGRYDIALTPREKTYPGIIAELKWTKDSDEESLRKLAREARSQIERNAYDSEMKETGIRNIVKIGIAFSGKKAAVAAE